MQKKFRKYTRKQIETGSALVMVLLMSTILLLILTTGITWVLNTQKNTTETFKIQGQAGNVAQAGLQDGVSWFKRQETVQQTDTTTPNICKDAAFAPQYSSVAEDSDTDNASVGMVRDYEVKGRLYGRYILKRQNCSAAEDPHAVKDITALKGKSTTLPPTTFTDSGTGVTKIRGEGIVWYLESEGILYERNNFAKSGNVFTLGPDQAPNRILSRASAAVEISKLGLVLDSAPLTLFATGGTANNIGSRCRFIGGTTASAAVFYNGLNPNMTSAQRSPVLLTAKTARGVVSPQTVFAVSEEELRGMADNVYTSISQVPKNLKFSITFLDGNYTFDNVKPLQGGGLLYVNGNLTLNDSSNSLFSGVIYVDGTLTMGKDNTLAGGIVAQRIACNPGSGLATFEYNNNLITSVRQRLALYRENNLTHSIKQY